VVTIDENFSLGASITTDTITGNVAGGAGAFGAITLTGTTGDISKINLNTIETSGTAANATLTLSSTDGNFVATGVDLSAGPSTVPVTLTNATTGATITLSVNVATALDDAAIANADTEIRLDDFLENVAASDGSVNVADARPGDPGYDPTNPGFYEGDNTKLSVRIDPNATVNYGVTADEPGFEKLFRALYMVRNANVTPGNIDRATLESALGLAIEAIQDIPDIRSRIGSDRLALEQMKGRHLDFNVYSNEAINQIESVDIVAAVARLSTEQVQLEASYMLTARLSQLTLANFLR
jgi:flagellar hook-associated protein 3 FlgL